MLLFTSWRGGQQIRFYIISYVSLSLCLSLNQSSELCNVFWFALAILMLAGAPGPLSVSQM